MPRKKASKKSGVKNQDLSPRKDAKGGLNRYNVNAGQSLDASRNADANRSVDVNRNLDGGGSNLS